MSDPTPTIWALASGLFLVRHGDRLPTRERLSTVLDAAPTDSSRDTWTLTLDGNPGSRTFRAILIERQDVPIGVVDVLGGTMIAGTENELIAAMEHAAHTQLEQTP